MNGMPTTMFEIRPWLLPLGLLVLGWLLYLLSPILMPFAAGALLAYLGNPLVNQRQIVYLESRLPRVLRWFNRDGIPWFEKHLRIQIDRLDMELIGQWLSSYWVEAGSAAGNVLTQVAKSSMDIITVGGMLVLIPVVTFYLLLDWVELL